MPSTRPGVQYMVLNHLMSKPTLEPCISLIQLHVEQLFPHDFIILEHSLLVKLTPFSFLLFIKFGDTCGLSILPLHDAFPPPCCFWFNSHLPLISCSFTVMLNQSLTSLASITGDEVGEQVLTSGKFKIVYNACHR